VREVRNSKGFEAKSKAINMKFQYPQLNVCSIPSTKFLKIENMLKNVKKVIKTGQFYYIFMVRKITIVNSNM